MASRGPNCSDEASHFEHGERHLFFINSHTSTKSFSFFVSVCKSKADSKEIKMKVGQKVNQNKSSAEGQKKKKIIHKNSFKNPSF